MEQGQGDKETKLTCTCTVLAIDHTNFCYRACAVCERSLPEYPTTATANGPSLLCKSCVFKAFNPPSSASKRLFRILVSTRCHQFLQMSVATDTEVFTVIWFDRAARVLFGCSADEFFDFAKLHPYSGQTVNEILEGEMFTVTLSKPKNGSAQNLRVASAVPLSSGFRPAIEVLRECYGSPDGS